MSDQKSRIISDSFSGDENNSNESTESSDSESPKEKRIKTKEIDNEEGNLDANEDDEDVIGL